MEVYDDDDDVNCTDYFSDVKQSHAIGIIEPILISLISQLFRTNLSSVGYAICHLSDINQISVG